MCNNVTQVMGVHGWRCSVGSRVGGDWTEKMQIDDIMLQRERVKKKKKEYGVVCHWSKGGRSRRAKREGAALVFLCH